MADIDDRFVRRLSAWYTSASAISREDEGVADPPAISTEQLFRAHKAWATALGLWQDENDAFAFLTRQHAMLDDEAPVTTAMASADGLASVQEIIGRLRYGSAA